jgi:hypothetical protein
MKRFLQAVIAAACFMASSPQHAVAHGGRWSCGSYYSGYTYYYPRYYYPSYNNCSYYYGNYGSYYGNGYVPYPNYGSYSPYNNLGLGLGSGNLLGLLAGNSLFGANLGGSLLQPSYLSMPVSVGYGQSGFLQIPMGSPAGRATYLQIPVNTGYGPSSYLQIELGRNSSNSVPGTPTPSANPNVPPFGAIPGVNNTTAGQFTYDIPKTPADEVPPVVLPLERSSGSTSAVAASKATPTNSPSVDNHEPAPSATTENSKFQFVSWSSVPVATQAHTQPSTPPLAKDTSFSLVGPEPQRSVPDKTHQEQSSLNDIAFLVDRESTPWVAN